MKSSKLIEHLHTICVCACVCVCVCVCVPLMGTERCWLMLLCRQLLVNSVLPVYSTYRHDYKDYLVHVFKHKIDFYNIYSL